MFLRKQFFLIFFLAAACEPPAQEAVREVTTDIITISIGKSSLDLTKPAVEFDHALHTASLEQEGCKRCHPQDRAAFIFKFERKKDPTQKHELMELYHDKCIGCHKDLAKKGDHSAPRVCSGCHEKKTKSISSHGKAAFDYSLHARHVNAVGKERCDACHHQYDEKAKKLIYIKGKEDACLDCHGKADNGKNLSLKNASHATCINCHIKAAAAGKGIGPVLCDWCHDKEIFDNYEKMDAAAIPRLERGQKDTVFISQAGTDKGAVIFDHKTHEGLAKFCTTCHHKTPGPCKDCHTLIGSEQGKYITTEQAYHRASSNRSCIGCHVAKTKNSACAGCHRMPSEDAPPSRRTCAICHGNAKLQDDRLADLPPTSEDFPETIEIKILAHDYMPSKMPHQKMVKSLDEKIRKNKPAAGFHGQMEVVCAGCHHRSPLGDRPIPCSGCHAKSPEFGTDKPNLKAAYHRQCIGCHQSMKIEKAKGCTDCHEKAKKDEVAK